MSEKRALLRPKYEHLLAQPWQGRGALEVRQRLNHLRRLILLDGLPAMTTEERTVQGNLSLRGRIWTLLLLVKGTSAADYITLINQGPSAVHDKIDNDAFRTFASDKQFTSRVSKDQIIRVLSATAQQSRQLMATEGAQGPGVSVTYVQGMNVLVAPFLYVMPELDAFGAFSQLVRRLCPMYVRPNLDGVYYGVRLFDECLRVVDPDLARFLIANKADAKIYAFPLLLTMCSCVPPLDEVLKLWDFLIAFGFHLAVLCTLAQYILIRDKIIASPNPMKVLQQLPPLRSQLVIALAVRLIKLLPSELYERLVRHPYDERIYASRS